MHTGQVSCPNRKPLGLKPRFFNSYISAFATKRAILKWRCLKANDKKETYLQDNPTSLNWNQPAQEVCSFYEESTALQIRHFN